MKPRLDKLLVERGLAPDQKAAGALVMAGRVRVNGRPAGKPGDAVHPQVPLEVIGGDHPFVSRGGVKLEAALDRFGLDVTGLTAMDIGASTGGFTHCLLLRGASRVIAVDVGYGQLAWELRQDPRVVVMERTNFRHLAPQALAAPVDLMVMDLSFISLSAVLPHAARFLTLGGRLLALVKPQFEAPREQVESGGRVVDPGVHAQVLDRVSQAARLAGFATLGLMESPVKGKKSRNREFLLLLEREATPTPAQHS
ncbi:MAG: TlyA family RNA methyltransferase [Deltaproteobacteria bacterium]|nr:TlyA family RNA methyltransferase [Deltaproteobacteria bacterium]